MLLVETLQTQHRAIEESAEAVNQAVGQNDVQAIRVALDRLAGILKAHLLLEDRELYPGILAAAKAKNDEGSARIAEIFATNMSRITESLSQFLDRHQGANLDVAAFKRDWSSISGALKARIASEESSLYPLHRRLTKK